MGAHIYPAHLFLLVPRAGLMSLRSIGLRSLRSLRLNPRPTDYTEGIPPGKFRTLYLFFTILNAGYGLPPYSRVARLLTQTKLRPEGRDPFTFSEGILTETHFYRKSRHDQAMPFLLHVIGGVLHTS